MVFLIYYKYKYKNIHPSLKAPIIYSITYILRFAYVYKKKPPVFIYAVRCGALKKKSTTTSIVRAMQPTLKKIPDTLL